MRVFVCRSKDIAVLCSGFISVFPAGDRPALGSVYPRPGAAPDEWPATGIGSSLGGHHRTGEQSPRGGVCWRSGRAMTARLTIAITPHSSPIPISDMPKE
jgi:hypothetical protein